MRITKQILVRRWAITTILAGCVFAVLAWSDLRLKTLSGFGTADLQGFSPPRNTAGLPGLAVALCRARRLQLGPGLSFDAALCRPPSSIPASLPARLSHPGRQGAPHPHLLAAVPIAGAVLDAAENGWSWP